MRTSRILPRIATHIGGYVNLVYPEPDSIHIEDIAHALALINRYTGHSPFPYSVAQHSVLCSLVAPTGLEFQTLMHDAQEAYVGDMSSPLKQLLPEYQVIEWKLEEVLRKKFGLPIKLDPRVKEVDTRMLVTEAKAMGFKWWNEFDVEPYVLAIEPWTWRQAKAKFLDRFEKLKP